MKYFYLFAFSMNFLCIYSCAPEEESKSWNTYLKEDLTQLADSLRTVIKPWEVPGRVFVVEDFGGIGDSLTLNTKAIQRAIDSCSNAGGGTVLFKNGNYVTGTIDLKANVMLEVAKGSRILGSTNLKNYPNRLEKYKSLVTEDFHYDQCLIYAEGVENIGIRGEGEIDFRGSKDYFPGPQTITGINDRPFGIRMIECRNIVMQNITLKNSAAWMQHYMLCKNLLFDGINVYNHANVNNDGLDLDASQNVWVKNCKINSEDDAFCMKGIGNQITRNILVENSSFYSKANAFKIGTDTQGDFENIIGLNLDLGGIREDNMLLEASTGITLATVDGGNVKNIYLSEIEISGARCPVFLRLGDRGRVLDSLPKPTPGEMTQILIENVTGQDNFSQGSFISGIASKRIEKVLLKNIDLEMSGGGTSEFAGLTVVEDDARYPDAHRFHKWGLPAYGMYIRHAQDLLLENVRFSTANEDARNEFVSGENIKGIIINGEKWN